MSASYSWPGGLPQVPQSTGYSESIGTNVSRLPMDSGKAKIRFSSLRGDKLSLQYLMTGAQLDIFEDFVKNTIRYTRRFYLPHPRRKGTISAPLSVGYTNIDPMFVNSVNRSSGAYYRNNSSLAYASPNTVRYEKGSGILVESAATNLSIESVTPASWFLGAVTLGSNIASPDSEYPAKQWLETATTGPHYTTFADVPVSANERVVASVYVRELNPALKRYVSIMFPAAQFTANKEVFIDPATGLFGAPAGITEFGSEKIGTYYRFWAATSATVSGTATIQIRLSTSISSVSPSYAGNVLAGGIFWGRQVEIKASGGPTSLIRTTTAAATRAADSITASIPTAAPDMVEAVLSFNNGVAYRKTEVAPNHYIVSFDAEILPI